MASIRKARGKWLAEVRIKGHYASKTFYSKSDAHDWATDKERELGKHKGAPNNKTFGDALQRFHDEVSPTRKGAKWEQTRINKLLRDPLASIPIAKLERDDFQDWIDRQTNAPGTVLRELNLIKAVLREARVRWRWISEDTVAITRDLRKPKPPPHRDRRISDAEVAMILRSLGYREGATPATASEKLGAAFLFALETAMRMGEIWALTWENVHINERYVRLPETKNGHARNVPLSSRAVAILRQLGESDTGRVFNTSQAKAGAMFRAAVIECGIENLTFHDTRHEAITRLARKLEVLDLARMVGHRDIKSLMTYYNATASEIARKLD